MLENISKKLRSRITQPTDNTYPEHALHLWSENRPVKEHNSKMLDKINKQEYVSIAPDKYPPSVDQARVKKALSRNASQTGGLERRSNSSKVQG